MDRIRRLRRITSDCCAAPSALRDCSWPASTWSSPREPGAASASGKTSRVSAEANSLSAHSSRRRSFSRSPFAPPRTPRTFFFGRLREGLVGPASSCAEAGTDVHGRPAWSLAAGAPRSPARGDTGATTVCISTFPRRDPRRRQRRHCLWQRRNASARWHGAREWRGRAHPAPRARAPSQRARMQQTGRIRDGAPHAHSDAARAHTAVDEAATQHHPARSACPCRDAGYHLRYGAHVR